MRRDGKNLRLGALTGRLRVEVTALQKLDSRRSNLRRLKVQAVQKLDSRRSNLRRLQVQAVQKFDSQWRPSQHEGEEH